MYYKVTFGKLILLKYSLTNQVICREQNHNRITNCCELFVNKCTLVCVCVCYGGGKGGGREGEAGEEEDFSLYPNALSGVCKVLKLLRVNFFPILI